MAQTEADGLKVDTDEGRQGLPIRDEGVPARVFSADLRAITEQDHASVQVRRPVIRLSPARDPPSVLNFERRGRRTCGIARGQTLEVFRGLAN